MMVEQEREANLETPADVQRNKECMIAKYDRVGKAVLGRLRGDASVVPGEFLQFRAPEPERVNGFETLTIGV